MKYLIIAIIVMLAILGLTYALLINKTKSLNIHLFKYKEEVNLKEKNILIVYQPSKHKTTIKIKDLVKEEISDRYGYKIHTLNDKHDDYSRYEYVIFITPVYFGEIHHEILKKIRSVKIDNLIIIYNGLNTDKNSENKKVKECCISKYKSIKTHTNDLENIKDFIKKEVL